MTCMAAPVLKNATKKNMNNPTLPKEAGSYILIPDDYAIQVEAGEYLDIVIGFTEKNKAGMGFSHPNIFDDKPVKMEFKHYHQNGSKSWTSEMGRDFTLRIPREQILLVRENGYSYPKVIINGETITLNVSGGGGKVWTDWIHNGSHTVVNLPIKTVKAIAEVSMPVQL